MGYATKFTGILKFTKELKASEIAYLSKMLGIDFREAPGLLRLIDAVAPSQYAVDLEFTKDYSGLQWSGIEKSYNMEKQVELVIRYMQSRFPDFGLEGHMYAQGEDIDDSWILSIKDNKVIKTMNPHKGQKVQCPYCDEYFYLEDKNG